MVKGVITREYKERFVDRVAKLLYKMKLYQTDGYYPITETETGKEVAAFVCIKGNAAIVRFLEWITAVEEKAPIRLRLTTKDKRRVSDEALLFLFARKTSSFMRRGLHV